MLKQLSDLSDTWWSKRSDIQIAAPWCVMWAGGPMRDVGVMWAGGPVR